MKRRPEASSDHKSQSRTRRIGRRVASSPGATVPPDADAVAICMHMPFSNSDPEREHTAALLVFIDHKEPELSSAAAPGFTAGT
jgi:hypothetical protein